VNETLGPSWLSPDRFRIGASSLLDDLLMQREKDVTGNYSAAVYVASA
jgi:deoxyribose-phosphate aldolase